jgi:hypothetical protein
MRSRDFRPLALAVTLPLCGAALALGGCKTEQNQAARVCPPDCDQPKIPAGVPGFDVVGDEVTGPSDGQNVKIKVVLRQKTKRDEIYPALHFLYRYAMTRGTFEPSNFWGEFYATQADASSGNKPVAKIAKEHGDKGPKCENLLTYDFAEQVERAFLHSLNRGEPEDLDDTCHIKEKKKQARFDDGFTHKPSFTVDASRQAVSVNFPYLDTGKDQYAKSLSFNEAMTYWVEFMSSMFHNAADLKELTYVGVFDDQPVVKITVTRAEYDAKLSTVQETVAAHSAIIFAKLGMHKTDDKGAKKDQEQHKTKTYKAALAALPKDRVFVSPKLK